MTQDEKQSADPIAIISVHGVADQQPYESARQIAQLLLEHSEDYDTSRYQSFTETAFQIPEERFKFELDRYHTDVSYEFLKEQLTHPRPKDTGEEKEQDAEGMPESLGTLRTIRLEGDRNPPSGSAPSETQPIHIYEMYWADLSRLQNELFRVFGEFYQLLFHLSRIGHRSVYYLKQQYQDPNPQWWHRWSLYNSSQTWAERALTLGFPVLNLFMLVSALMIVPSRLIPEQYLMMINVGSAILAAFVLIGAVAWQWTSTKAYKEPPMEEAELPPLSRQYRLGRALKKPTSLACLALLLVGVVCVTFEHPGAYHYLACLSGLILTAIALFILNKYGDRRPWAKQTGWIGGGLWGLCSLCLVGSAPNTDIGMIQVSFQVIEWMLYPLLAAWLVFNLGQIFAWILGLSLTMRNDKRLNSAAKYKIRQATWTARLSLALSSALFLVVTMILWYALVTVSQNYINVPINYFPHFPLSFFNADICDVYITPSPSLMANCFAQRLVIATSTSAFSLVCLILLIPVFVGAIAFFPSIRKELFRKTFTPFLSSNSKVTPETDQNIANAIGLDSTKRLSRWLSQGLLGVYWTTEVFIFLMVVFALFTLGLLFFNLSQVFSIPIRIPLLGQQLEQVFLFLRTIFSPIMAFDTENLLPILALLIVSSATGLLALGSRLAKFSSGVRSLLDVVLDVDNYLRVNPRGNNPKARIFNRYTSLVRYICDWRNPTNPSQKYQAIIIIAHSQGTVITADLLRILQYSNTSLAHINSGLQPPLAHPRSLPIYLYTMGSPLQQLYGVAFPSLYHWVKDFNQVRQFGLTHWKNVYCSGDYVGRSLWAHREIAGFDEVCLGAGAHTHYWDGTIPAVAQYLDELIQAASSCESQDEVNTDL